MVWFDWFRKGQQDALEGKGIDPKVPRDRKLYNDYHRGHQAGKAQLERNKELHARKP